MVTLKDFENTSLKEIPNFNDILLPGIVSSVFSDKNSSTPQKTFKTKKSNQISKGVKYIYIGKK